MMSKRVEYVCSDYDLSAHKGTINIDIQHAALRDRSIDIVLTPHVLEHVPDTEQALKEIYRILKPGGQMFLQIPMPQGVTAPPAAPEYHGDNTVVYWRFGWDIGQMLQRSGFAVHCLVTGELKDRIARRHYDSGYGGGDCDEVDLLSHGDASLLTPVASGREARRYGFLPDFMFVTWEATRPV
jgi:SAM-dependent methyltransferase